MNKIDMIKKVFIFALATQILIGFGFGAVFLANPQFGFESFNVTVCDPSLGSSAVVIAGLLLFSGLIALLSIIWTLSNNISGVIIGLLVGLELVTIGSLAFLMYGNVTLFMIDGIRGVVTLVSGVLVYRSLRQ